jgi:hypothetical protein
MGTLNDDDEIFEAPFPDVDALRPYTGRWVGFDETGAIRVSGGTFAEAEDKARSAGLELLTFFGVPAGAVIG